MRFEIFTLFPDFFISVFGSSILKRGQESGALRLATHDIRAWTSDRHHVCDDSPYGGGAGMVMKADPVARAVEDVLEFPSGAGPPCPVIYMSPQGRPFSQRIAEELSGHQRVALLCGHYEGIDERAIEAVVTDEISIGDYVLTGGEVAAAVVVDAVARFVPGVLGNGNSARSDSFSHGLLEAPHYTRPAVWREREVPAVLVSGHHAEVEKWRFEEGVRRSMMRRPDLLQSGSWSPAENKVIESIQQEFECRGAASGEKSDG